MSKNKKIPEAYCRVIHKSGAWFRSPAVSPKGVVAADASDMSCLTTTRDIKEASVWPLPRAMTIARMFVDAIVDRVDVELGTSDHRPNGPCTCGCGSQD